MIGTQPSLHTSKSSGENRNRIFLLSTGLEIIPAAPEWLLYYAVNRRKGAERDVDFPGFPRFYCAVLSQYMARELRALGVQDIIQCFGYVQLDKPFEPLSPDEPGYCHGEEADSGRELMPHHWLELKVDGRRWMLDLTGDQFNPYLESMLPSVLLVPVEGRPSRYSLTEVADWSDFEPNEMDEIRAICFLEPGIRLSPEMENPSDPWRNHGAEMTSAF